MPRRFGGDKPVSNSDNNGKRQTKKRTQSNRRGLTELNMELLTGLEPVTSSLPKMNSKII